MSWNLMAGIDFKSNFKSLTSLFFSILEEQAKMKLCAWAKGTDTCQGDSGGPLAVPENGQICIPSILTLLTFFDPYEINLR